MDKIPDLPQPALPITRYNSKVLLCWHERAILVNCIARKVYRSEVNYGEPALLSYGKAREAAQFGLEIKEVLISRGYDVFHLDSMVDQIEEDVFA